MLTLGLQCVAFIMLRYVPSICYFFRAFFMIGCWWLFLYTSGWSCVLKSILVFLYILFCIYWTIIVALKCNPGIWPCVFLKFVCKFIFVFILNSQTLSVSASLSCLCLSVSFYPCVFLSLSLPFSVCACAQTYVYTYTHPCLLSYMVGSC